MNLSIRSLVTSAVTLVILSGATVLTAETYDESLYKALKYRNIGPFRGGRSAAVAGIPGNKMVAYFGGTGGGVWKRTSCTSSAAAPSWPVISAAVSV